MSRTQVRQRSHWTDRLGQTYQVGDWIAAARGSAYMRVGIVEALLAEDELGNEYFNEYQDEGDQALRDQWMSTRDHKIYRAWQDSRKMVQDPSCVIVMRPTEYAVGGQKNGNRISLRFPSSVIKIPAPS